MFRNAPPRTGHKNPCICLLGSQECQPGISGGMANAGAAVFLLSQFSLNVSKPFFDGIYSHLTSTLLESCVWSMPPCSVSPYGFFRKDRDPKPCCSDQYGLTVFRRPLN